jgi:hypothetical protein
MAVSSASLSAISSVSNLASEGLGVVDELGSLYGEINSDAKISEEAARMVRNIHDVQEISQDIGYSADEVDQILGTDVANIQKLTDLLRTSTRAIRAGKGIYKTFLKLEDKAKLANVQSAHIANQALAVQVATHAILENDRIESKLKDLRAQKERKELTQKITQGITKNGGTFSSKNGFLDFPLKKMANLKKSIEIGKKITRALFLILPSILFFKIVLMQFSFASAENYFSLFRRTLLCFLFLSAFPQFIEVIIGVFDGLIDQVDAVQTVTVNNAKVDFVSIFKMKNVFFATFEIIYRMLENVIFNFISFGRDLAIATLVAVFPIMVICSYILNYPSFSSRFFLLLCLLIFVAPVTWKVLLLLSDQFTLRDGSITDYLKGIVFYFLQFQVLFEIKKFLQHNLNVLPKLASILTPHIAASGSAISRTLLNTSQRGFVKLTGVSHRLRASTGRVMGSNLNKK